jgi:pimeloyl-ACP methyl ester carboxylesterase
VHVPITRVLSAAALAGAVALTATPTAASTTAASTTTVPTTTVAGAVGRDVPSTIHVGSVTLGRCDLSIPGRTTYCGSIKVPLDYRSAADGTITVGFGWVPAAHPVGTAPPRTLAAEEGGPGYPSTGTAPDYVAMYGARLLATNNLLLVDERGTGRSTAIDCKPMEALHIVTTTPAFSRDVRACGESLNHRFRRQGGGFVHASDLFTTANGARDLKRVMLALRTGPVDLYGDSYGTYFAQSFLAHFPDLVRSVTLDSAYEARDLDPWYVTTVRTARRAFDHVCAASAACHAQAPGKSWHRITRLATLLRAHPFSGTAVGVDAAPVHVTINITSLVNLVNDAGYDYDPYRQLDAAARAYLNHRDGTPLLRLFAQDIGYDYSDYNAPATYYSDGQYFAVGCTDYPQLFTMKASPKRRRAQFAAAEARYPAHAFAPFTVNEWVSMDPLTETYHACTAWPRPVHRADPPVPAHVSMDAAHVPVLILNGAIDSLTPAAGGAHIHRQIGSASRHIVTANTVHLVALDTPASCGRTLLRRFITTPSRLHSMSASCAPRVRTVRTIGNFPLRLVAAVPVHGSGSRSTRQLASVALAAAGDEAIRYNYVDGSRDLGLRGGTVHYLSATGTSWTAVLRKVKWTTDTVVSGQVTFTPNAFAGHGVVTIIGPTGKPLRVKLSWRNAHAALTADGHHLTAPAP